MGYPHTSMHRGDRVPSILLSAEADHIQDLLFRSTRLREVAGGSWALERFWEDAADLLAAARSPASEESSAARVLVTAGGAFRVVFTGTDARMRAEELRRDLQDLFALQFGGRISVALAPADGDGEGEGMSEPELVEAADLEMLRAKAEGDAPTAAAHLPYVQPCGSCGQAPTAVRVRIDDTPDGWEELCEFCQHQRSRRDDIDAPFLKCYRDAVDGLDGPARARASTLAGLPQKSEDVGAYDGGRRRVAYLLADGNGFGRLLSPERGNGVGRLREAVRGGERGRPERARRAAAGLAGRLAEGTFKQVPLLPLITGGDDVFALLPAPWAFWTAREFATAFVESVARAAGEGAPPVSVSCVLVFCKDTFPYRIAHRMGEEALRDVKRVARLHPGVSLIRGIELRDTAAGGTGLPAHAWGTFALDPDARFPASVQRLIEARRDLQDLKGKRRHQVEALYAGYRAGAEWEGQRKWLTDRARDEGALQAVLDRLDAEGDAPPDGGPRTPTVDLLHLWDYLQEPSTPEARP